MSYEKQQTRIQKGATRLSAIFCLLVSRTSFHRITCLIRSARNQNRFPRCFFVAITAFLLTGIVFPSPGDLDLTFGTGGKVTDGVTHSFDAGYDSAVQPDGKLVVAGKSWTGSTYDFALARYTYTGGARD